MKSSLSQNAVIQLIVTQANTFFPDGKPITVQDLASVSEKVFARIEHCFSQIDNRYFFDGDDVCFNHLHADQYAMLLYFYANTLFREGANVDLCSKLFLLNKTLHGVDAFYEVELPDIFLFVHPFGAVLGRGEYADYLIVYQGTGVGSNHDVYPKLGEFVSLHPGASVLGDCKIGNNCKISANSTIMDKNLEDNSVYIGTTLQYEIKKNTRKMPIWRLTR